MWYTVLSKVWGRNFVVVLIFFSFRTICLYGIQCGIGLDKDYSDSGYI
jgi:hypothetical protein